MSDPSVSSPRVEVAGSVRTVDPGWQYVGPADPSEPATVSVYVLDPAGGSDAGTYADASGVGSGRRLSREEDQAAHRAHDEDIRAVLDFAAAFGLAVAEAVPSSAASV